jgi:hypothetical protein
MLIKLNFPYMVVKGDGSKIIAQAPAVDKFPSNITLTEQIGNNIVLTDNINRKYRLGMYQYSTIRNRWQFVLPYEVICGELFTISQMFVCFPNAGDNLLPIGDSGQALLTVTRNGVSISNYDRVNTGLVLNMPAVNGDIYCVLTSSPFTSSTSIPAGIPDAPLDGIPYVRNDGFWDPLQEFLNEGQFVGS